jgi:hypothetical protein
MSLAHAHVHFDGIQVPGKQLTVTIAKNGTQILAMCTHDSTAGSANCLVNFTASVNFTSSDWVAIILPSALNGLATPETFSVSVSP